MGSLVSTPGLGFLLGSRLQCNCFDGSFDGGTHCVTCIFALLQDSDFFCYDFVGLVDGNPALV